MIVQTGAAASCVSPGRAATVTIDKTLKRKGRLARSRNVLQRHERIQQMKTDERWNEGQSPFGLPKLRVVKLVVGKKKKKKAAEGDAAADDTKKAAKKK
jgi:small basic protein (TIGR04137 family)